MHIGLGELFIGITLLLFITWFIWRSGYNKGKLDGYKEGRNSEKVQEKLGSADS